MRPFPLFDKDADPESPVARIIQGALGKLTILDSAPTQAANPILEGEGGYFNNKIYFTIGGTLKEFAVTSTA